VNAEELAAAVEELDTRLERLRVLMDMYFQGIEKIPPNIVQKDVERRIWVLRREKIRNTGTRFRFQQIVQRYNTFGSYWQRIMREIENGTYKRDVLRAKKRFGPDALKPQPPPQPNEAPPPSVDLLEDDLSEDDLAGFGDLAPFPVAPARPAPPGPPPKHQPAAAPPPAAPAAPVVAKPAPVFKPPPPRQPPSPAVPEILAKKVENDDDLDDMLDAALGPAAHSPKKEAPKPVAVAPQPAPARPQPVAAKPTPALKPQPTGAHGEDFRRVYAQYVEARRKNGESTAGITYETLAKSLAQTKEKLRDRTAGKKIDFEVAVKDGKTILKPVVR
jgi:hypothetical protein